MLSLIIPTYNERENLPILIPSIITLLRPLIPFEIIVVDDNSPDKTGEIVEKMSKTFPEVHLIRRYKEKDLSGAVITGFQAAKGDILGVIDADLQHDETILPMMLEGLKEVPLVVASRYLNGSVANFSLWRKIISWGGKKLAQTVLKVNLTDPLSGFFVMRRELFESCAHELNPRGFKVLLEIIYRSKVETIMEVPYVFKPRLHGASKLNSLISLNYLMSIYDLVFGQVFPVRGLQYCIVGLWGTTINLVLLFFLTHWGMSLEPALALSILVAMMSNYLINNAWTFQKYRHYGLRQLAKVFFPFVGICSTGAFLNFCVAIVLAEKLHMNIYVANLIGIIISAIWNFKLTEGVIWKVKA
jgi:dolichol-phosphate mannosyltransferase